MKLNKLLKVLSVTLFTTGGVVLFFVPENPPLSEWEIRSEDITWRGLVILWSVFLGIILLICSKISKEEWKETKKFLKHMLLNKK